jgi:hypothetical protein
LILQACLSCPQESWVRFCVGRCPPTLGCQKTRPCTACGRAAGHSRTGPMPGLAMARLRGRRQVMRRVILRMESPNRKGDSFPDSCVDGVEGPRRLAIPRHRRRWRERMCSAPHRCNWITWSSATRGFHRRRNAGTQLSFAALLPAFDQPVSAAN